MSESVDNPHLGEPFDLAEIVGEEAADHFLRNLLTILAEPRLTDDPDVLARFEHELERAGLGGWEDGH